MEQLAMKSLQEIREDLETNQERIDSEQPEYLDEGLLKTLAVTFMVLKVRSLMKEVARENDPVKQNALIARQNSMLSYLTGVSIFSSTGDKELLAKLKRMNPKTF